MHESKIVHEKIYRRLIITVYAYAHIRVQQNDDDDDDKDDNRETTMNAFKREHCLYAGFTDSQCFFARFFFFLSFFLRRNLFSKSIARIHKCRASIFFPPRSNYI